MPQADKDVEEMKEWMTILMDIQTTQGRQDEKLNFLLEMKPKIESAHNLAATADQRSQENEKDIDRLRDKVATKASKSDVDRIVEEKDNWKKNAPGWAAAALAVVAILLPYLTTI